MSASNTTNTSSQNIAPAAGTPTAGQSSSVGNLMLTGAGASNNTNTPTFSPLYQQIKALILQQFEQGQWKPGEMIPSETELATRFKVSQGTVRKAIDELAAENIVVRKQGKGTFVATHHEARAQFRFLRLVPDEGEVAHPESQVLDCKRVRATGEIARQLDLKSGDAVVQIRRVLSFQGNPTIVEDIWLPGAQFKGLTAERLAEYKGPMYGLFETEFGVKMVRADERIRAVAAQESVASALQVPVSTPVLLIERLAYSYAERAMELRYGWYLTQGFHYHNELG